MKRYNTAQELRSDGFVPRLHGNGFIQIDLSNDTRLHFFNPKLSQYGQRVKTLVHDHVFNMRSDILFGRLHNSTYEQKSGTTNPLYDLYSVEYDGIRTHESTLKKITVEPVRLGIDSQASLTAGSWYTLKAGILHSSFAPEMAVTIIKKTYPDGWFHGFGQRKATVASYAGMIPDNDFKRDSVDPHILDLYIDIALKEMGGLEI